MRFSKNEIKYKKPSIGQKISDEFYFVEELPFSDCESIGSKHRKTLERDNFSCTHCHSQCNHFLKVLNNSNTISYIFVDDNLTPFFSRMIKSKSEGGTRSQDNLETCCEKCMRVRSLELSKKINQEKYTLSAEDKKKLMKRYKLQAVHVFGMNRLNRYNQRGNLRFFSRNGTKCISCDEKAEFIIVARCRSGYEIPRLFTKDMYMLTVDHIVPRSLGGTNNPRNKQTMCSFCNQNKADSLELSFSSDDLTVKTPSVNSEFSCMVGSMYLWPEIPASYYTGQLYS